MKVPFVDLKREYEYFSERISAALDSFFSRGSYVLGEAVEELEECLARLHGFRFGVGTANATDALELALRAAGVTDGDEVITVANTAIPTGMAILNTGAVPVFCDIKQSDLLIDPDRVSELVSEKTRAIVAVNLYGAVVDRSALAGISSRTGIPVIEDMAQSHGASREGPLPLAACLSFYPTKNLGCYGDGGMILTNEEALAEKLRMMRNYGQETRYRSLCQGRNSRLDELQAAILLAKLSELEALNARRRKIAQVYRQDLGSTPLRFPTYEDLENVVFHLCVALLENRDLLIEYAEHQGVQLLVHYPLPLHRQPAFEGRFRSGALPLTERVADRIVSLPCYPFLERTEQELIVETIREFFGSFE